MRQETRQVTVRMAAEFVVIVVGVLVAFGVQDWADRGSDRLAEVQYLERLAADLRGDSAIVADRFIPDLASSDSILRVTQRIARSAAPFPVDTISFLADLSRTQSAPFFWILSETYDELLATGSLAVLESSEVRSAVVSYYASKLVAGARAESRASTYPELIRAYLPEVSSAYYSLDRDTEQVLRDYGLADAVGMIRTAEFRRALNQQLAYLDIVRSTLADLLSRAEQLILVLDKALGQLR